jgi:ribonucleoside-diphosphate reductase beta chain
MFEEAVLSNIAFMEQIHSKTYSSIFSTLSNTRDINDAFRWSSENEYLRKKQEIVMTQYRNYSQDPMDQAKKKAVSVLLESFLFYSGFYLPLYFNGQAKLTNTADGIRLILRDESIHGYYLGAKFQESYRQLSEEQQEELQEWTYDILQELYENEIRYTQDLYDEFGLTEEVKTFLRYNANRALGNLGFDALFPKENVNPVILTQLDLSQETHDFFSGSGAAYVVSVKEDQELDEEEWDF